MKLVINSKQAEALRLVIDGDVAPHDLTADLYRELFKFREQLIEYRSPMQRRYDELVASGLPPLEALAQISIERN